MVPSSGRANPSLPLRGFRRTVRRFALVRHPLWIAVTPAINNNEFLLGE